MPEVLRSRRRRATTIPVVVLLAVVACGGEESGDAERFCGEVEANRDAIVRPPRRPRDVDAMIALYRDIGDVAPLAIDPDWQALVLNLETASTVDPDDPDSRQRVYARAYATERSALAVRDWLVDNCDIDIGPVATIVPPAPSTPPTTTTG